MYKLIYKILFTLIIAQIISISGCLDSEPQNTGVERIVSTKIIKTDYDVGLIGFNSLRYNPFKDYNNQRVIVHKSRDINGWSVMEPDIINIVYERNEKESFIKNNVDKNIQNLDDPEDNAIPVPTNYDQYSDLVSQDTDPVPSSDSSYIGDE